MDFRIVSIIQCAFASIILISTVAVSAQRQGECCQVYCYDLDNERPQTTHFATKTPYLIAKGPESGRQYKVPSTYSFIYVVYQLKQKSLLYILIIWML